MGKHSVGAQPEATTSLLRRGGGSFGANDKNNF